MSWLFTRLDRYCLLCLGMLAMTAPLFSADLDSLGLKQIGEDFFVIHEVEENETLYSLSKRYQSKVKLIRNQNDLEGRRIEIGQVILIPVAYEGDTPSVRAEEAASDDKNTHVVAAGETIYSISRKYGVQVRDIRQWNGLEDTNISIGQELMIRQEGEAPVQLTPGVAITPVAPEEVEVEDGPKYYHFVQPGETIYSISRKYSIGSDTIKLWNKLETNNLNIGQKLLIRQDVVVDSLNHEVPEVDLTNYGSRKWKEDQDGILFVKEEGVTGLIEETENSSKSLALHRDLPVGTEISILNLMNNRRITAKIVGKLPNTGLNRNLMLRLTASSFKELGIIDNRSRIEISYRDEVNDQ